MFFLHIIFSSYNNNHSIIYHVHKEYNNIDVSVIVSPNCYLFNKLIFPIYLLILNLQCIDIPNLLLRIQKWLLI